MEEQKNKTELTTTEPAIIRTFEEEVTRERIVEYKIPTSDVPKLAYYTLTRDIVEQKVRRVLLKTLSFPTAIVSLILSIGIYLLTNSVLFSLPLILISIFMFYIYSKTE